MKYICIGDSLTYGYGVSRSEVWTKLLSDKYQIEVINKGINGDTTAGMLARFQNDVVAYKPSHVIIMGGTNDFIMGSSLAMVRVNISTMVHQAMSYNIIPVIGIQMLTDPIMAKLSWSNVTDFLIVNNEIEKYRQWVINFSKIFNVPFIDFYDMFDNKLKHLDSHDLYMDGLHPTFEGNKILAEAIEI